ncbi:tRNA lysidine(34) synthetase TilS [Roseibium sp.]|uniref:tRNA lysidine(34) synthetase TilS n=1 Tax=Roseibium sp. TaxID=1936156 RepID=UPI003B51CEC9
MSANVPNAPEKPVQYSELRDGDIDQLFASFKDFSEIALAVSGGADSTCLLIAFHDWVSRNNWDGTCEVLTVDHQLRPESSQETGFVQDLCNSLGIPCFVLKWKSEKPASGLQEAARDARYQLIADHLSQSGSEAVVLAHHLDDQAETFLDRLTRGSGIYGLGAMAPDEPNGPAGLRLIRPFLDVPKESLIATLEARNQSWCEDPSNQDHKYKRSRLRKISGLLAEEGLSTKRIATTARQLRRTRAAIESVLAHIFFDHVEEHPAGPLRIQKHVFTAQAEEFRLRLLILMIERVTGRSHLPKLRKIEALDQWILAQKNGRQTLGGAMLEIKRDAILVWKEVGRARPATLEAISGSGCWDNRFLYRIGALDANYLNETELCLGPLYNAPVDRQSLPWPKGWPKEAFECSPVFWTGNGAVCVRSAASLFWQDTYGGQCDITLQRIPFPPKLAGNYRTDLEGS